ncbi:MAG: hypothetical protein N2512_15305, partial [Armatimonadetes bacterium]|nr:hypothetical protein [Armatimonadota bacterium]
MGNEDKESTQSPGGEAPAAGQPPGGRQPVMPPVRTPAGARLLVANVARLREFATFIIVVAVVLFFHLHTLPKQPGDPTPSIFLSPSNIKALLVGMSSEAILVAGMAIVIVGGGFDISVGSVLALAG